jgi:hypothetical protein
MAAPNQPPIIPPPAAPPAPVVAGVIIPPPPAPPAPVAAGAPVFSLTPAALHTAAFIDLGTTEGRKLFSTATKPLDEPYDGAKTGIHMFIHQVATRALICGWTLTIMTVPKPTVADPNATLSLITQHGQIDLADIEAHARMYQNAQVKSAQDSSMMKIFLDGSLSKTLMLRVLSKKTNYTFGGIENGPAMFRVILQLVGLETNASVAVINALLRTMPAKMTELKSDIVAFNEFVTEQCNELTSRGQQPYDILHLLFEAYRTATNDEFQEYIRAKQSAVYDGSLTVDYHDLMTIAEEKYKIMKIKGEWKATKSHIPTTDDHIIALQAQVLALQSMSTSAPTKATTKGTTKSQERRTNTGKWAWKDSAPKSNESQIKVFEGRKYVHCPNQAQRRLQVGSQMELSEGQRREQIDVCQRVVTRC